MEKVKLFSSDNPQEEYFEFIKAWKERKVLPLNKWLKIRFPENIRNIHSINHFF